MSSASSANKSEGLPASFSATFFLLGISSLLPWNAYLKSFQYFMAYLGGSGVGPALPNCIFFTYTLVMLGSMAAMVLGGADRCWPATRKALAGLLTNFVLISMIGGIPAAELLFLEGRLFGATWFTVTVLLITALTALSTAVMMKSLFEIVAKLNPALIPAFNGGQAGAGIFVSLVSLLGVLMQSRPRDADVVDFKELSQGTLFFFSVSALVLLVAAVVLGWLSKQPAYTEANIDDTTTIVSPSGNKPIDKVIRMVWDIALGITMTMAVTLAFITSYIGSAVSCGQVQRPFLPVTFLSYDLGDFVGRWLPASKLFTFPRASKAPYALPWLRLIIFFPLFCLANIPLLPAIRRIFPVLIGYDWAYFAIVALFGASSGYCCTLLMLKGHQRIVRRYVGADLEAVNGMTGALLGLSINVGLVIGSMAAFLLRLTQP